MCGAQSSRAYRYGEECPQAQEFRGLRAPRSEHSLRRPLARAFSSPPAWRRVRAATRRFSQPPPYREAVWREDRAASVVDWASHPACEGGRVSLLQVTSYADSKVVTSVATVAIDRNRAGVMSASGI